MNVNQIVAQISAEIAKLQQAKALLESTEVKRSVGRPKSSNEISKILGVKPTRKPLSVEAKTKIAEAQKRRWAKVKRAAKTANSSKAASTNIV